MKLHIKEAEYNKLYDGPKTDIADRIAAWAYSDINTVVDKICDIEDFIGHELPSKCTYSVNFLSIALQETCSLNQLERIEAKFMKSSYTNESITGKNAVWLDFRLEPEMKGQLKCADCEQTLNGRNCKSSLVHAVSAKWDKYDGMEWRCFCTRCYNGLKDEDPDEILDGFEPSTNY